MLLVDAIYIHDGGGKVLLDYLIEKLEETSLKVYYLLDDRIPKNAYEVKEDNVIKRLDSRLKSRVLFYKKSGSEFCRVLCLGNIPPNVRLKAEVYTYFHNTMYIGVPKDFSIIEKIKYKFKVAIINHWKKNTDFWLVQSETLKNQFISKFNDKDKVSVLPFFPTLKKNREGGFGKKKHTYLYVSNAQANKNHLRLIEAFCEFFDKNKKGELIVTVSNRFPEIIKIIEEKKKLSYPINNIGFVDRITLIEYYKTSKFVIFPSLAESFGLGLVEGIEFECNIIGADLPYTYAICEPSIVFDPEEIGSIIKAFEASLNGNIQNSFAKVQDEVDKLISLLK